MKFKDLVREYIDINEDKCKEECKKGCKKPDKKTSKKPDKKNSKKHEPTQYKGQYPEGPDINGLKGPKGKGLMKLDALASLNLELTKNGKRINQTKDTYLPHGTTGRIGGRLTPPEGSKYKDEDLAGSAEDYAGSVSNTMISPYKKTKEEKEYEAAQTDQVNPSKKLKELQNKEEAIEKAKEAKKASKKGK